MGGRYYMTGVQLGMLMTITDEKVKVDILQRIMDSQFMGNFDGDKWKDKLKQLEEEDE